VLSTEPIRASALLSGGVLSFVILTSCWISLNGAISPHNYSAKPVPNSRNDSGSAQSAESSAYDSSAAASGRSMSKNGQLSVADRKRLLAAIRENLKNHYFDRVLGQKMADALAAHENRGEYSMITDPASFAALLTKQMRAVNSDRHISFDYFQKPLPRQSQPLPEAPQVVAQYPDQMKRQNCTIEKVDLLSGNIGYLKLNSFPDLEVCRVAIMAAMTYVNHAEAVIFDLRDNRGGYPATVQLVGSYLFDHPEYWYNPRE